MQQQGRYTILGEIAAGGTATVFLAEDSVLRRKVALKKLHPHLLNHPEMVRRFEKEAVAVASLSHENVIKIFDYGQEEKGVFLAMEYVDGVPLETLLREAGGTLPCLAAVSLFRQLLGGLAAAHARGICHRDIKPSNVLVDRKGCVRIADFGIAFLSEETSITRTGSYLGTPGYSSPEQAQGQTVTVKSDIFAAGILLYRSLAGRLPFEADSPHAVLVAIMEKTPADLNLANRRLIPGLSRLVERMLAKSPAERPTAEECATELSAMARSLGLPLDAARVRRLYEAPEAYAAEDRADAARIYLDQARSAHGQGKSREAMKLFALAEAFSEPGDAVSAEAAGYLRRIRSAARRRRVLAYAACLALAMMGWMGIRRAWPERNAGSALPAMPAGYGVLAAAAMPADRGPEGFRTVTFKLPEDGGFPGLARPGAQARAEEAALPARLAGRTAVLKQAAAGSEAKPSRPRRKPAAGTPIAAATGSAAEATTALAAVNGYLWVRTNPPFVRVVVDGKARGATPLTAPLALSAGPHRLDLEREGCHPAHETVSLAPAETVSLRLTLGREGDAP